MKKILRSLTIWQMVLICSISYGKEAEFRDHANGSVYFSVPDGWILKQDFWGFPFILFSPKENTQRSQISFKFQDTFQSFEVSGLEKEQKVYRDKKKTWAKKHEIEIDRFYNYTLSENKSGHLTHTLGFSYQFNDNAYVEKSYFIQCYTYLIKIKSLRLKENYAHEQDFKNLIREFDCK